MQNDKTSINKKRIYKDCAETNICVKFTNNYIKSSADHLVSGELYNIFLSCFLPYSRTRKIPGVKPFNNMYLFVIHLLQSVKTKFG